MKMNSQHFQTHWDTMKVVLRGKFIALERSHINNLIECLRALEHKEEIAHKKIDCKKYSDSAENKVNRNNKKNHTKN